MVYKKFKIIKKDEKLFPNLIRFELNGLVEFSNGGKKNFVLLDELPFKNYQVGDEIEIDGNSMEVREVKKDYKNLSESMDVDDSLQLGEKEDDSKKPRLGLMSTQEQLSA